MTQANSGASSNENGKGEHKLSEVYENLEAGLWSMTNTETDESELLFSPQLPEEIQPEKTDENEDGSSNPKRN